MADEPQPTDASRIIRVGTSGFSYTDWLGPFFPPRLSGAHMLVFSPPPFYVAVIHAIYYAIPGPPQMASVAPHGGVTFRVRGDGHQDMTRHGDRRRHGLTRV